MIDRELGIPLERTVASRKVIHRDMEVMEIVAKWQTDNRDHYKLIWIRHPMQMLEFDGRKSPFVHKDFDQKFLIENGMEVNYVTMRKLEEAARCRVITAFDEYWHLGKEIDHA